MQEKINAIQATYKEDFSGIVSMFGRKQNLPVAYVEKL